MDALINPRERDGVASACRLIRTRWTQAERHQRRQIAEAKQQALWRLFEAACSPSGQDGFGEPAAPSGADTAHVSGSTGVLCLPL
jgi:hypothetical protein